MVERCTTDGCEHERAGRGRMNFCGACLRRLTGVSVRTGGPVRLVSGVASAVRSVRGHAARMADVDAAMRQGNPKLARALLEAERLRLQGEIVDKGRRSR